MRRFPLVGFLEELSCSRSAASCTRLFGAVFLVNSLLENI